MSLDLLLPAVRNRLAELPPGTLRTLGVRILAVGFEFLSVLLLARLFQASVYGSYSLVMACIAIAVVPAAFGFDRLMVREVATFQAAGDWQHLRGLLRRGVQTVLLGSGVAALIVLLGGTSLLGAVSPEATDALLLGTLLIPIIALMRVLQGALQGYGSLPAGLVPESILQPGLMIGLAIVVAFASWLPRTVDVVVAMQVVASAGALILAAVLVYRRTSTAVWAATPRYRDAAWLRAGSAFMLLVGMSAVLTNADTLLIGTLLGATEAGIYRVASQFAMFVALPLTAASLAIAPRISATYATSRHDDLRSEIVAAARVSFVAAIGIGLLIAATGRYVLEAFGAEFPRGYVPMLLLIGAYWVHCAMATSGYLLMMSGHERLVLRVFALGAVANVCANLVLIPRYGLPGAAIATGSSLILVSAGSALLCWRKMGINATIFASMR